MSAENTWSRCCCGEPGKPGWSAIVYIAAIAGIDQELYEVAKIDGASRFQRVLHITVPAYADVPVLLRLP